jgi:hypothetical protein
MSLVASLALHVTAPALLELELAIANAEPSDIIARPLVLARGELDARLTLDINLEPNQLGHSTSLAPDLWVGVTSELTVGVVHSYVSVDRFATGATLCVVHQDVLGCESTYHNVGVDARYGVMEGDLAVAPRVRAWIRELEPFKPALTFGALVRWTRGRFALTADPYLQLGLANTDRGNRHELWLPLAFSVQPLARWELALHTGWDSMLGRYLDLDGERKLITDAWHVPVAFATRVAATPHVDVGAILGFSRLLGPQNTAKERALFFTVAWRGAAF